MKIILDYQLKSLTSSQRMIFTFIIFLLLIFGVFGNIATIFVNSKRKIRPLFRACLLSLALSDLISAVFMGVTYLTQFSTEYIQIWHLGDIMCCLIPFLTTAAILVNSMTLVGIALDRFIALKRISKKTTDLSPIFCGTFVILIWGLSAGVASPMISSYTSFEVFIILTDPDNATIAQGVLDVKMCAAEKSDNGYYYVIVFAILFLPSLVAFLTLNCAIAREIWIRRHFTTASNNSNNLEDSPPSPVKHQTSCKIIRRNATRETRQLRVLCVIVLLMLVFLICRLPTWIYLIMKLYGEFTETIHWILHFSFGSISLASCILNPLLYTFLTGTIEYTIAIRDKILGCCSWSKLCYCGATQTASNKGSSMSSDEDIYTISGDK